MSFTSQNPEAPSSTVPLHFPVVLTVIGGAFGLASLGLVLAVPCVLIVKPPHVATDWLWALLSFLVIVVMFGPGALAGPALMRRRRVVVQPDRLTIHDPFTLSKPWAIERTSVAGIEIDHWENADAVLAASAFETFGRLVIELSRPTQLGVRHGPWRLGMFNRASIAPVRADVEYQRLSVPCTRRDRARLVKALVGWPIGEGPQNRRIGNPWLARLLRRG